MPHSIRPGHVAIRKRDRVNLERMSQTGELLWYILWVGLIAVAAMLIALVVSRTLAKRLRSETRAEAFTIQDLREMRERGEITEQEYYAMRATVIGNAVADAPTSTATKPGAPSATDRENEDRQDGEPSKGPPDDER